MDTDRKDWRDDAACLHADPDLFFPIGLAGPALRQVDEAKRICRACPVRTPCLKWALGQGILSGVWGGTTEEERRAIRQAAARTPPALRPGAQIPTLCAVRRTASRRACLSEGGGLVPMPGRPDGHGMHLGGNAVAPPRHGRDDLSSLVGGLPLLTDRHLPRRQWAQHHVRLVHDFLPGIFRNICAITSVSAALQADVNRFYGPAIFRKVAHNAAGQALVLGGTRTRRQEAAEKGGWRCRGSRTKWRYRRSPLHPPTGPRAPVPAR
jgi:WhiB family transcriptional regulator, redox-sensing transcriptional regulator